MTATEAKADRRERHQFQEPKPVDLSKLGTAEMPLRPSKLDHLVRCSMKVALDLLTADEDEGGSAAQTGGLFHKAAEAFHLTGSEHAAFDAAASNAGAFPLADPNEVRLFLAPYLGDPRNRDAQVVIKPDMVPAVEMAVSLTLPAHDTDPTGQPIVINGTLDQIRNIDGQLYVIDLKTGKPDGWAMVHDYLYQQAAYFLAARQAGWDVIGAKLLRVYGYRQRNAVLPSPDGVFWEMPFDLPLAWVLMDRVRLAVALLRAGNVDFGPGSHCNYCPFGGVFGCMPKARELLQLGAP